jgi:hypothetical protein
MRRSLSTLLTAIGLIALAGCAATASSPRSDDAWVDRWLRIPDSTESALAVAVVDGGMLNHPVLDGRVIERWEAEPIAGTPRNSHATEMAGLILGANQADDDSTTAGIELLDVRVLDEDGLGRPSDVAAGVRWAVERGAEIILMSLSISTDDPDLRSAVEAARASDVLIVASTANGIADSPSYPAEYPGVLGVTSTDSEDALAPLAGAQGADIAAPGHDVFAPTSDRGSRRVSGTSVAAAVAVSVLASCPGMSGLTEAEIVSEAENSGVTITSDRRRIPVLRCISKER